MKKFCKLKELWASDCSLCLPTPPTPFFFLTHKVLWRSRSVLYCFPFLFGLYWSTLNYVHMYRVCVRSCFCSPGVQYCVGIGFDGVLNSSFDPCLFLPFWSIHLHFFPNLYGFFLLLLWLTRGSCVGLQNKNRSPCRMQVPVLSACRIQVGSKNDLWYDDLWNE